MAPITPGQMKRLNVLYGQLCRHTDQDPGRDARLVWASSLVMRPIASFKDLTSEDARHLIDTLQGQFGIAQTTPPRRTRLSREAARKAGTEGRRGFESNETTLASERDWKRINYILDLLGWDRSRLDGFLRSPTSPIKGGNPQIRTLHDANRVWWALKRMAQRAGKWKTKAVRRAS